MERCSGGPSEKLITGGRGSVGPWIAILVPVSYAGQCEGGPSERGRRSVSMGYALILSTVRS